SLLPRAAEWMKFLISKPPDRYGHATSRGTAKVLERDNVHDRCLPTGRHLAPARTGRDVRKGGARQAARRLRRGCAGVLRTDPDALAEDYTDQAPGGQLRPQEQVVHPELRAPRRRNR